MVALFLFFKVRLCWSCVCIIIQLVKLLFASLTYRPCLLWTLQTMVRAKMISWRQLIVELGQEANHVVSRCFVVCGSIGIICLFFFSPFFSTVKTLKLTTRSTALLLQKYLLFKCIKLLVSFGISAAS